MINNSFHYIKVGIIPLLLLTVPSMNKIFNLLISNQSLRLFANISQYPTIHIQDMSVNKSRFRKMRL